MTDLDETLTNLRPGEALLYTPPNGFEIVPVDRRPRLEWERVEIGADEHQWRANMPALIAELREARENLAKLPHHCGGEACRCPASPYSDICGCSCDGCVDAEDYDIFVHEAAK